MNQQGQLRKEAWEEEVSGSDRVIEGWHDNYFPNITASGASR